MNAFLKSTDQAPAKAVILALIGAAGVGGSMILILTGQGQWPIYAGAIGMALTGVSFGVTAGRLYRKEPLRPTMRRFLAGFLGSVTAYALFLVGAIWLYATGHAVGWLGYASALAPALAVVAAFASLGAYVLGETDELLRRITVESLLWALGATLSLATAWGIFEAFGLAPHLQLWVLAPVFAVLFGLSSGLVAARYR